MPIKVIEEPKDVMAFDRLQSDRDAQRAASMSWPWRGRVQSCREEKGCAVNGGTRERGRLSRHPAPRYGAPCRSAPKCRRQAPAGNQAQAETVSILGGSSMSRMSSWTGSPGSSAALDSEMAPSVRARKHRRSPVNASRTYSFNLRFSTSTPVDRSRAHRE